MGYYSKDGSYVYDDNDLRLRENMKKGKEPYTFRPTGEATTGSIYDADEETLKGFERMVQAQKNSEPYTFRPTGEATTGSIYDADEETLKGFERMIAEQRKEDAPNKQIVTNLLKKLPNNFEELNTELEKVNYRLDLMKPLVEGYRDQFFDTAKEFKNDFSNEASAKVNNKLEEYLCLIETLKKAGYNFGSTRDSYNTSPTMQQYDPYKPEMLISEVMTMMHLRRKEGADINIIFPVDYDLNDKEYQPKGDAVTITNAIQKHLQNNPYMEEIWKRAGYETPQNSQGHTL